MKHNKALGSSPLRISLWSAVRVVQAKICTFSYTLSKFPVVVFWDTFDHTRRRHFSRKNSVNKQNKNRNKIDNSISFLFRPKNKTNKDNLCYIIY